MTKCPVQSKRQRLKLSYLTSGDANHRGKLGYRAGCINHLPATLTCLAWCEQPDTKTAPRGAAAALADPFNTAVSARATFERGACSSM